MATRLKRTHFIFELVASWIDTFKRELLSGGGGGSVTGTSAPGSAHTHTFTGTPPQAAEINAGVGTGYTTVGQVVTTTDNFTCGADAYAGCWLLVQGEAPCLIDSHPAVTGAPLVLTVFGLAPPTSGSALRILRGPTPMGTNDNESAHTHTAGSYSAGAASAPIHYDVGEFTITTANASDLATSIALAKALVVALFGHLSDALAHEVADDTNLPGDPMQDLLDGLVDLNAVMDLANGMKDALNAHFTQSGVHAVDDVVRTITSPDATDQTSANTLLNELKTDLNAHMAAGSAIPSWRVVDP